MKLPIVIDNIIEKNLQEKIKLTLLSDNFNWFFISDVTHASENKQQRPGFQHRFVVKEKINSDYHNLVLPIIENSCKHIQYDYKKIIQGRSFLQLPLSLKNKKIDTPHIDLFDKHLVILYYVTDADGDVVADFVDAAEAIYVADVDLVEVVLAIFDDDSSADEA